MDGLGSLASVTEAGSATTSYGYDALDNLVSVNQSGQGRSFAYTSLSRLSMASNPESGTTYYYYDNNGNLARKVDARDVTTCFGTWNGSSCNAAAGIGYDRLNRVLRKQYSATTPATPGVTYTYDCATNGKGLPCGVANSESASNIGAYDKLGRVTASSQVMAGVTYPMSYGWDIAGNMRSMTLPSARTLTWSYDNAARATGVTGTKAGEANRTYASGTSYAAHGGLANFTMGNGMTETWGYNSRMQPRQVSAVRSGTTQLGLGLYYCGAQVHTCGDNNGNPRIETIAIPGKSWTRSFGYDGWNRVSAASEGTDSRNFGYSATGNMWVTTASGGWAPPSFTPRTSAWFDANNRLVNTGLGVQYDAAGNQTVIGGYAFTYDAEGRMTGSTLAGATTVYAYDGEGRRVKKTAAGVSTVYVYGAGGELAAEYGGPAQTTGTRYITTDHLGSTRLVTNASGDVISRHDYLPFGEEIPAGVGGRTTAMGYVANPAVTRKFTGKERDAETGLDYFEVRYISSAQGRFTSPDEPFADQYEQDAQSWNLYSYVRNNPLRFVDPTGRECVDLDGGGQGDDGNGTPCAGAQLGTTYGVTVTGKKGNAVGAFLLNAAFALDNTANNYFAWMFKERPQLLANTPTTNEFVGQAAAATVFVGTAFIGPGSKAPILGRKLDYLLGLATGNAHNIARSGSMASALSRIGIHDSAAMRQYLAEHLTQVLNDSSNIVRRGAGTEVRESLLMGPGGAVKLETVWQGDKLITAVVKEGAR